MVQSSLWLTHLSLISHKRGIGKQCRPRSDAAESGSTMFALSTGIFIKIIKTYQTDTHYIGNGPVRRVKVEESIQHKWVNCRLE